MPLFRIIASLGHSHLTMEHMTYDGKETKEKTFIRRDRANDHLSDGKRDDDRGTMGTEMLMYHRSAVAFLSVSSHQECMAEMLQQNHKGVWFHCNWQVKF